MSTTEQIVTLNLGHTATTRFTIGISLATLSTLFIGVSFVVKKNVLIRLKERGERPAGSGGHGYLRDRRWWLGLIFMAIGELLNFSAYMFAPAAVVTCLGGLSILVSTLLASKILKEQINLFGKCGGFLALVGSSIVVLNSPDMEDVTTFDGLINAFYTSSISLVIFLVVVLLLLVIIRQMLSQKNRKLITYLFLCSFIGSLTVIVCKVLGLVINEYTSDKSKPIPVLFISVNVLFILIFILVQIHYLNRALDLFNTSVVTPIYYVMFTTMVTATSGILFGVTITLEKGLGSVCGFIILAAAITMLSYYNNNTDVTNSDWTESHESLIPSSHKREQVEC